MKAARFGLGVLLLLCVTPFVRATAAGDVNVKILEGIPDKRTWKLDKAKVTETYTEPAFGFLTVPTKYSPKAHALDRSTPFVVRASANLTLPAGEYRVLVRAFSAARFYVDGKLVIAHGFPKSTQNGHNKVRPEPPLVRDDLPPLLPGQNDIVKTLRFDGKPHNFRLDLMVGSRKTRPELGKPAVAIANGDGPFRLLAAKGNISFDRDSWPAYARANRKRHQQRDVETRKRVSVAEVKYWQKRHEIARQIAETYKVSEPPKVKSRKNIHNVIDQFLAVKLDKAGVAPTALTSDYAFLRRVTLDTVGVVPSRAAILAFAKDNKDGRRARVIERLLNDPRWADHWVSFWQDLLAENPGLIKPSLNNTGPFRYWLHQALTDNLPIDRFVTELIMMEGSVKLGAPAAFSLATKNDVPMAAKAHIISRAFLAVDLSCARCHDAPNHPYKQKQLFGMASMLKRTSLKVPATSSVKFDSGGRKPLVEVTLPAGSRVKPQWLFPKLAPTDVPMRFVRNPKDSRAKLAAIITSPHNRRFAKVLVNRLWQRYMGVALVDNLDDWSEAETSHPKLLDYLAHELITHDYDLKQVAGLILNSHAYQRVAQDAGTLANRRLFAGPARRRMTAEQLLDSLFVAVGKEFDCEELTFDPECWQKAANCPNLGKPRRAWQFVSLSNERDRPALALPIAQGYVDLLSAFGWRASRPAPLSERDDSLTPLQIMTLANGQVMHRLVRLTDDCAITRLCLKRQSLKQLVDQVYERILSRRPSKKEAALAIELLQKGYPTRRTGKTAVVKDSPPRPASWSVHLLPEATRIQLAATEAARAGPAPTMRLQTDWRERMEDFIWSLVNSPEFVFVP